MSDSIRPVGGVGGAGGSTGAGSPKRGDAAKGGRTEGTSLFTGGTAAPLTLAAATTALEAKIAEAIAFRAQQKAGKAGPFKKDDFKLPAEVVALAKKDGALSTEQTKFNAKLEAYQAWYNTGADLDAAMRGIATREAIAQKGAAAHTGLAPRGTARHATAVGGRTAAAAPPFTLEAAMAELTALQAAMGADTTYILVATGTYKLTLGKVGDTFASEEFQRKFALPPRLTEKRTTSAEAGSLQMNYNAAITAYEMQYASKLGTVHTLEKHNDYATPAEIEAARITTPLSARLGDLRDIVVSMSSRGNKAVDELAKTKGELDAANQRVAHLQEQLARATAEKRSEGAASADEITQLRGQLAEAKAGQARLKTEAETRASELRSATAELARLQGADEKLRALQAEQDTLRDAARTAGSAVTRLEAELAEAKSSAAAAAERANTEHSRALENARGSGDRKVTAKQAELERAQAQVRALEALQAELQRSSDAAIRTLTKEREAALAAQRADLSARIVASAEALGRSQAEAKRLTTALADKDIELGGAKARYAALEESLTAAHGGTKQSLKEVDALKGQLATAQAALVRTGEEKSGLSAKLAEAQADADAAGARIAALQAAHARTTAEFQTSYAGLLAGAEALARDEVAAAYELGFQGIADARAAALASMTRAAARAAAAEESLRVATAEHARILEATDAAVARAVQEAAQLGAQVSGLESERDMLRGEAEKAQRAFFRENEALTADRAALAAARAEVERSRAAADAARAELERMRGVASEAHRRGEELVVEAGVARGVARALEDELSARDLEAAAAAKAAALPRVDGDDTADGERRDAAADGRGGGGTAVGAGSTRVSPVIPPLRLDEIQQASGDGLPRRDGGSGTPAVRTHRDSSGRYYGEVVGGLGLGLHTSRGTGTDDLARGIGAAAGTPRGVRRDEPPRGGGDDGGFPDVVKPPRPPVAPSPVHGPAAAARPGLEEARPGLEEARPGLEEARPGLEGARPGEDDETFAWRLQRQEVQNYYARLGMTVDATDETQVSKGEIIAEVYNNLKTTMQPKPTSQIFRDLGINPDMAGSGIPRSGTGEYIPLSDRSRRGSARSGGGYSSSAAAAAASATAAAAARGSAAVASPSAAGRPRPPAASGAPTPVAPLSARSAVGGSPRLPATPHPTAAAHTDSASTDEAGAPRLTRWGRISGAISGAVRRAFRRDRSAPPASARAPRTAHFDLSPRVMSPSSTRSAAPLPPPPPHVVVSSPREDATPHRTAPVRSQLAADGTASPRADAAAALPLPPSPGAGEARAVGAPHSPSVPPLAPLPPVPPRRAGTAAGPLSARDAARMRAGGGARSLAERGASVGVRPLDLAVIAAAAEDDDVAPPASPVASPVRSPAATPRREGSASPARGPARPAATSPRRDGDDDA